MAPIIPTIIMTMTTVSTVEPPIIGAVSVSAF